MSERAPDRQAQQQGGEPTGIFPAEDAEPIFTLTFLLEVPQSLRIAGADLLSSEPGPPWEGWSREAMAFRAGFSGLPADHRPNYRLIIDQARVRGRVPLAAADRIFHGWDTAVLAPWRRILRSLRLRAAGLRGSREWQSAAMISRFLAVEDLPGDGDPLSYEWLSRQLDETLGILNEYLVTLAARTDEWHISSISKIDLQRVVPFMIIAEPHPPTWINVSSAIDAHAYLKTEDAPRPIEELLGAVEIVRLNRSGRLPFFPWLELYQSAEHHLGSGRYAQSVIAACTGIEVLINTLFRVIGAATGQSPTTTAGILSSGFRNQLETHLPKLLNQPVDLGDRETKPGRWYADCYLLRNRVVHEGYKPSEADALNSKLSTGAFSRWFAESLADDPRTEQIKRYFESAVVEDREPD